MPSSEYGRLTRARSGLSPSSIPFSVGDGGHHGGFGGRSPSSVSIVVGGLSPHHSNSSTRSEIFNGGGSDSSSPTKGASVASPAPLAVPPPGPIPLPVDRFTLPVIKNDTDYLAACDLILYWLRRPGFSTARSDSALITDLMNALAS